MLRRSAVLCILTVALMLDSVSARAEGLAYRVFVSGNTPGEPSTGKQATAYSLYALSGLSLVAGGYFLTEWSAASDERDAFNAREPGACASLVSETCAAASRLDEDKNRAMNLALGFRAAVRLEIVPGSYLRPPP